MMVNLACWALILKMQDFRLTYDTHLKYTFQS